MITGRARLTLTHAVVAALLLLLGACGSSGDVDRPLPPPPSPSASPSLQPPVMPALAREHSEAGAKAFVEYYWTVVNYTERTLDTTALAALATENCGGCRGGVAVIDSVRAHGGSFAGGANHVAQLSARKISALTHEAYEVTGTVVSEAEIVRYQGSVGPSVGEQTHRLHMVLVPRPEGWVIDLFEPLS